MCSTIEPMKFNGLKLRNILVPQYVKIESFITSSNFKLLRIRITISLIFTLFKFKINITNEGLHRMFKHINNLIRSLFLITYKFSQSSTSISRASNELSRCSITNTKRVNSSLMSIRIDFFDNFACVTNSTIS